MLYHTALLLSPLMLFLWPPGGRHRFPLARTAPAGRRAAGAHKSVLPGEASPLVGPYLLAREERERRAEARRQRAPRRVLWLAVRGVDVGSRFIHGAEVAA
ncbi:hypothetical protein [Streptomyces sp. 021-4]|uniref:hypothetical protein n=1 Tax=Streptomyces sp. 021-4 TaxID=2789260 RepID=UPI0039F465DA